MKIDRLVGYTSNELEFYKNFISKDFFKYENNPNQYTDQEHEVALLAKSLKHLGIWIGDDFSFKGKIYTLVRVTGRYKQLHETGHGSTWARHILDSRFEEFPAMIPTFFGELVNNPSKSCLVEDLDYAHWIKREFR